MSIGQRILDLHPPLSQLPALQSYKTPLQELGRKLEDKQRCIRALEVLYGAKSAGWSAVSELAAEIKANSQVYIVLTEGFVEAAARAVTTLLQPSEANLGKISLTMISSNTSNDVLERIGKEIETAPTTLIVLFYGEPSPRLLWCYRLLYSHLVLGRHPEEIKRRVILAAGETTSPWTTWARSSGFRTLAFPENSGGRYLMFSEPIALLLALSQVSPWPYVEGARSFMRHSDRQSGLDDPIFAYAALRELHLSEANESLHVPDQSFRAFGDWWALLGDETRRAFSDGQSDARTIMDTVLKPTYNSNHIQWRTKIEVLSDHSVQVPAIDASCPTPWPKASRRDWSALEPYYQKALNLEYEGLGYLQPSPSLLLRRRDATSVGALFAFFEVATSVAHQLCDRQESNPILTVRPINSSSEVLL